MKFAFCLYKYFPFGGLQRNMLKIAEECKRRGHEVDCYVRHWEGDQPEWMSVFRYPVRAVTNIGKDAAFVRKISPVLQKTEYDVTVGFNRIPGVDVFYAADPCLITQYATRSRFYRLTRRYQYRYAWEKQLFGRQSSTTIFVLTRQAMQTFQENYETPEDRFKILPPNLDAEKIRPENYQESPSEIRTELGLQSDTLLLLTVASAFETKGVDRVIKAIAELPSELNKKISYVVVGNGKTGKNRCLARKLGIENKVIFTGGRHDVPSFYRAADLMVHPARVENTGTVLLEGMAMGLPVIATDVCGYAGYIKENEAGKVLPSPFNQECLTENLKTTLERQDILEKWANNGLMLGKQEELYQRHTKAADIIDKYAEHKRQRY